MGERHTVYIKGGDYLDESIFQPYLNSKRIFQRNREILRPSYIPDELPHRQEQINQLASILVTALKGDRPSNVLIFGKTGTGKTASVKYLGKEIRKADSEFNRVSYLYMNCEVVDTQYGVLQNIGNMFIDNFTNASPSPAGAPKGVQHCGEDLTIPIASSSSSWTR